MLNYNSRPEIFGRYIVDNNATIREVARVYGISKSSVHLDVTKRLLRVNPSLYSLVRKVLDTNLEERYIRGGLATKYKYLNIKKTTSH